MTETFNSNNNSNSNSNNNSNKNLTTTIPHSEIRKHDVLLGRGGQTNKHVGNKAYRQLVTDHQTEYLNARKKDKVLIARRIVAIVQENGGRFLKQGSSSSNSSNNSSHSNSPPQPQQQHDWEQVTDKRAQEKTSQALREGLNVRNQTTTVRKLATKRGHVEYDDDNSFSSSSASSPPRTTKRVKLNSNAATSTVSPSVVSVDGGEKMHVSFPPHLHLQLQDNNHHRRSPIHCNANFNGNPNHHQQHQYYFASMPPARPVPFLGSNRQLSKSDVTDACAV